MKTAGELAYLHPPSKLRRVWLWLQRWRSYRQRRKAYWRLFWFFGDAQKASELARPKE